MIPRSDDLDFIAFTINGCNQVFHDLTGIINNKYVMP